MRFVSVSDAVIGSRAIAVTHRRWLIAQSRRHSTCPATRTLRRAVWSASEAVCGDASQGTEARAAVGKDEREG